VKGRLTRIDYAEAIQSRKPNFPSFDLANGGWCSRPQGMAHDSVGSIENRGLNRPLRLPSYLPRRPRPHWHARLRTARRPCTPERMGIILNRHEPEIAGGPPKAVYYVVKG